MKTPASLPRSRHRAKVLVTSLCLIFHFLPVSWAGTIYNVGINTTALSGQTSSLAFDFVHGDGQLANNTVSVSNFSTNGTLSDSSNFAITDTAFFNEVLRDIKFGTFLSFTFELTENNAAPGADQFSFFLLDSVSFLPLFGTSDPTGSDALFAIDITGAAGGDKFVFEASGSDASWILSRQLQVGVPDSGSTVLLLVLSLGFLGSSGFLAARMQRV